MATRLALCLAACGVFLFGCSFADAADAQRPNVLLIVADDLNCDLACYGHQQVKSPQIDRLAARGVRFDRAYCQYPVCNPSRTSFLSGRRPDATGVWDNTTPPRTLLKEAVFLPEYFRQKGYRTLKVGKIYHTGDKFEDAASWDEDIREGAAAKSPPAEQVAARPAPRAVVLKASDEQTWDGFVARRSVEFLEQAARTGNPFFLGVGFRRPHAPYVAPQKYFDLYPPEKIRLRAEPADHLKDIPLPALTYRSGAALLAEKDRPGTTAAYWASVSFLDAQVGVVLDAVDRLKLWDNTVVVFVSDHGYHLGEHGGLWHKLTLFEESARVPVLVAAPGVPKEKVCRRTVELVDLYPTLTDLCGLPGPKALAGKSLRPLLKDPEATWDRAAFTVVKREQTWGRSVRTERFRYTEWDSGKQGAELYDHENDPHEYRNRATDPRHTKTIEELKALLTGGSAKAKD